MTTFNVGDILEFASSLTGGQKMYYVYLRSYTRNNGRLVATLFNMGSGSIIEVLLDGPFLQHCVRAA